MSLLIPPLLLRIRFSENPKAFGIWIPVFLLLPIAYAIILFVSFALALMTVVTGRLNRIGTALLEPLKMFHAFRGFTVDVQSEKSRVLIAIH